jgi:hypothetical protein
MTEYYNCVVILVITAKNIFFRYLYISDFQSYITSIEIAERGAEIYAILQSVSDTFIKRGTNPFREMSFAINIAASKIP